ncbi:MAG: SH3 domain-containing protein [Acidobacteria bacterium]|nr:SH3 domain-containing protein [Acidobacteriota bacterium]
MKKILLLCVLLLLGSSVFAQERYVKPVDDAAKDASFLAFRKKLIAAVDKKDSKFIYSILDPKIELSYGGDSGVADFRKIWGPEKKDSKFWEEFSLVIKNGGAFYEAGGRKLGGFAAPYTYSNFPDMPDLDLFEHFMIFGNNVNLREEPSLDAKVLGRLSYNLVTVTGNKLKPGEEEVDWYQVKTFGGKTGWIKAEYVRSPIDFRAGFEKKRGQWKMVFFIAGD